MSLANPKDESCCLPGDVIVTALPSGFFVGRALPVRPNEPRWAYVGVRNSFREAVSIARAEAAKQAGRAWVQHEGCNYYRIPEDDAEPFGFDDHGNIEH